MSEMIEITLDYMEEIEGSDFDKEEEKESLKDLFPGLKRWLE